MTCDTTIDVSVEYHVTPGSRGCRDSLGGIPGAGPPLEPDDDDELEILGVFDAQGFGLLGSLSEQTLALLEKKCWEDYNSSK